MKTCLTLATLLFSLHALSGAEPPELVTVRASYQKQIQAATAPINVRYLDYLENLKKQLGAKGDVEGATAVQSEIDAISALRPAGDGASGDKIVIWNQNNGGKGDRGTKKVNLSLLLGGRVVWSRKTVKVDWDATGVKSVEVPVPSMAADTLRVEVTDTVNGRGGLSEVELFKAGVNVAKSGEVKVSAIWENDPNHDGAKLTDGVQDTFWLLPDAKEGWAEITLKQ